MNEFQQSWLASVWCVAMLSRETGKWWLGFGVWWRSVSRKHAATLVAELLVQIQQPPLVQDVY